MWFSMPYNNVGRRFIVLSGGEWYSVPQLMLELRALKRINFNIQAQRDQALQRLGNMPCDAPFTAQIRFPAQQTFISEQCGDWGRKFMQLRTSLTFKDYAKDDKHQGASSSSTKSTDASDSVVAFHNSINSMLDQLLRGDGVYDLASFEAELGCVWQLQP